MRRNIVVLVVTGVSACGGMVESDYDSGSPSGTRTDGSVPIADTGGRTDTGGGGAPDGGGVADGGVVTIDAGILPVDGGTMDTSVPGDGKGWRCTPTTVLSTCGGHAKVVCVQDVDDGGMNLGLNGGSCAQVCPKPTQSCCANLCNPTKVNAHEYSFDCTSYGGC